MKTKASIFKKVLYISVPIVLLAIFVIKLKSNKEISQSKVYRYNKELAVIVKADTLQLQNVNIENTYSGTFEPNKETKISAELQGKVNEVLVDVGSVVKKGQVLVLLDNSLLKLQFQTIEVQIEGLEADVKRYTVLAKADAIQGVQLEKAELGLKSAKVQKATILEQLNKTIIRAPFNGLVTAKLSEVGAFAAPGVPLLQITDISYLRFTVNVPENELSKFKLDKSYALEVDAYPTILLTGKATMLGSKANVGSSFPIQFLVNNTSDLKVKSGMFGKVNYKSEIDEKGISIPSSVIQGNANQPQVYLLKSGKAILHDITISKKIQNKVVVASGLKDGDVLITNGFINLFDSANVIVK